MKKEQLTIIKGNMDYLDVCVEALKKSTLAEKYFTSETSAQKAILEGLAQQHFYIALNQNEFVGFFYIIPNGAFHSFPYLHLFVIKPEVRSKGFGSAMMDRAEDIAFQMADKLFLVVADFNPDGKRFYQRNGFKQVGEIPNLYREGITEYLMMKCHL